MYSNSCCCLVLCSLAPLVHWCFGINALNREVNYVLVSLTGSQFWLFRGLSLQEGYPQPLSALSMGANIAWAHEEEEEAQGAAASRWGLMWDPEDGPVWGDVGGFEGGQQEEDTWTQLLRGGVSGITTDRDGERRRRLLLIHLVWFLSSDVRSGETKIYNRKRNEMVLFFNGLTIK